VIPLHDDNPTGRFAVVTLLLIVVNLAVFAFVQPHGGGSKETSFNYEHAAIPCELTQNRPLDAEQITSGDCAPANGPAVFPHKHVWLAVLASMFLHASWIHVLGNMLFLWIFGNNVEDYLGIVGYVLFYVFAGIAATATYVLSGPGSTGPVIGASGAIAGVMGMYLALWPRARVLTWVPLLVFLVVDLPAFFVLLSWFGLQFLTGPNSGVAWTAHVGGFATGVLVGLALRQLKPPQRRTRPAY
jgi:membrane associated rhomboid family serine protease